jgi:hypothetical protein
VLQLQLATHCLGFPESISIYLTVYHDFEITFFYARVFYVEINEKIKPAGEIKATPRQPNSIILHSLKEISENLGHLTLARRLEGGNHMLTVVLWFCFIVLTASLGGLITYHE